MILLLVKGWLYQKKSEMDEISVSSTKLKGYMVSFN